MLGRASSVSIVAVCAATVAVWVGADTAHAATITVTATGDGVGTDGICTLREAISEANDDLQGTSADCVFDTTQPFGDDTISLGPGTFEIEIDPVNTDDNQSGDFDLQLAGGNLTIDGAGPGSTTVDGNDRDRVFDFLGLLEPAASAGRLFTLRDVTVRDGRSLTPSFGGGLANTGQGRQSVTIDNSHLLSNENATAAPGAQGGGGAIAYFGSGVAGAHGLTITDSTIAGNTTGGSSGGGGILVQGSALTSTTVNITDSSIDGNDSLAQGGSNGAGGIAFTGSRHTTTISGTSVSGNDNRGTEGGGVSVFFGGPWSLTVEDGSGINNNLVQDLDPAGSGTGMDGRGGGIFGIPNAGGGTIRVRDSEVSGNDVGQGVGGGISLDATGAPHALELNRATVANNQAGTGGGLRAGGTVEVLNATISGNTAIRTNGGNAGGVSILNNSSLELRHSTVAGNIGEDPMFPALAVDGVYVFPSMTTFDAAGSILVDRADDGVDDACGGGGTALNDLGYNVEEGSSCNLSGMGSLEDTDPLLGPLAENGGEVRTHALLAGSGATDLVPLGDCDDLTNAQLMVDARGLGRPFPAMGNCDAGAYELQDLDGDGLRDTSDNCPVTFNPGQEDNDGDGVGNVCDPTPNGPPALTTPPTSAAPTPTPARKKRCKRKKRQGARAAKKCKKRRK